MTDLRQAAEMALKRLDMYFVEHGNDDDFAALQALRQALAQPDEVLAEREACAKVCEQLGMATNGINERNHECAAAIRARGIDGATVGEVGVWGEKREWVGLTDEEIGRIEIGLRIPTCYRDTYDLSLTDFAKAVEAKLKEKNT